MIKGSNTITVDAPLNVLSMFVKAGSGLTDSFRENAYIKTEFTVSKPTEMTRSMRIPEWCKEASLLAVWEPHMWD